MRVVEVSGGWHRVQLKIVKRLFYHLEYPVTYHKHRSERGKLPRNIAEDIGKASTFPLTNPVDGIRNERVLERWGMEVVKLRP